MGENRPKAMRGGGMEDVIFAGAATRPARNFSEVSLFIDNNDRLAPVGFNDDDTLEITRRITRDIGSSYKVNGKDTRARDVQMLFADASTGVHSPALVRQGQIAELINAKPKDRRRILEEAAGISGLYVRRHDAELKLKATESNLERLEDVLEQLAGQLSQLSRQAKQAKRYKDLGTSLRLAEGLLMFRRWKEASNAHLHAQDSLKKAILEAAQSDTTARTAAKHRQQREEKLPPLREEQSIAGAVMQRLNVQKDTLANQKESVLHTIERLQKQIAQLDMDMQRESDLNRDAGENVHSLQAEASELHQSSKGHEAQLKTAAAKAHDASTVLQKQEVELGMATEKVARIAAQHDAATRFLNDAKDRLSKVERAQTQTQQDLSLNQKDAAQKQSALEIAKQTEQQAAQTVAQAEETLLKTEDARSKCQNQELEARSKKSEISGVVKALRAEIEALERLMQREQDKNAQILDDVTVVQGYEKALGAALADDLRAPRINANHKTGWAELPPYDRPAKLPQKSKQFSDFVRAPDALRRRIDHIGLVDAQAGDALQAALEPGQRLVSVQGDLWRWDGYKSAAKDTASTTALQLEQRNKLKRLKTELESTQKATERANSTYEALAQKLQDLSDQDKQARTARRTADEQMTQARQAALRAEVDLNVVKGAAQTLSMAAQRHVQEAQSAQAEIAQATKNFEEFDDLSAARKEVEDLKLTVEASRITMLSCRTAHDDIRRTAEERNKRLDAIEHEITNWQKRLSNASTRGTDLAKRRKTAQDDLKKAKEMPAAIDAQGDALSNDSQKAQARLVSANDNVEAAEAALRTAINEEREKEREASQLREIRARYEAQLEAAEQNLQQVAQHIKDELETTPEVLLEQLDIDPEQIPPTEQIEAEVVRLRRSREALGAVNLRAAQDADQVRKEYETLGGEKTDLEEAIKTLRSGISNLNKEGRKRLLEAFDQVNKHFSILFSHLFEGGEAKLALIESDDPLDAGLEIMCQPPGKKLSSLSLLSGGEQSLTAIALIFAVFLVNPAPICVLDEVDAPLDDANVSRFCDLLDEMSRRTDTRFLIITHHAVTMGRMDRLFGVTMAEQAVSQLVSVDLQKAEQMVA